MSIIIIINKSVAERARRTVVKRRSAWLEDEGVEQN